MYIQEHDVLLSVFFCWKISGGLEYNTAAAMCYHTISLATDAEAPCAKFHRSVDWATSITLLLLTTDVPDFSGAHYWESFKLVLFF